MSRHFPCVLACAFALLSACASPTESAPPPRAAVAPPPPAPVAPPARPAGTLYRSEVQRFVDRGFPQFLQLIEVEPSLSNGRFRGWAIVRLSPPEFWQGVDLKPGDVVASVNGMPIERETQAFDAFRAVPRANQLRIQGTRDGRPHTLEYRIVEGPPPAP